MYVIPILTVVDFYVGGAYLLRIHSVNGSKKSWLLFTFNYEAIRRKPMKKWTGCAALLLLCLGAYAQNKEKSPAGATREAVESKDAPKPIGPYSQAIKSGGFVFCAGQIALDPATGQLVTGDIAAQTERALQNLSAVLAAAGTDLDHAVKTTVFLKNISDFPAMNEVYGRHFKTAPARSTVAVAQLPRDALIEIEVIAVIPPK
jgi:2-iminobutanoate/2-iminopropanoate deaminase